jgi:hypothetical protein
MIPATMMERTRNSGPPLPALGDVEGRALPETIGPVIDAHVHIFPDTMFDAIWGWFDENAWPIRYRLYSDDIVRFLLDRGVGHLVALSYAHRPGIAELLNRFMADTCERFPGRVTAMGTVFPGEDDAPGVIARAFEMGLGGIKLHCHVQCFDMNGDTMRVVYEACARHGRPLVMHVSREPKSPSYRCDPYELCSADKLERVVAAYPELKVCVPHLGVDEFDEYARLIETYDNLWLDTAMVVADYFPGMETPCLDRMRTDRIFYGSDFPNIPYAWDREIVRIEGMGLGQPHLRRLMSENAIEFFSIR